MTETPNTLYHYCSTAAFQSIVENKQLWLTDLSLSNDGMEGKWRAIQAVEYEVISPGAVDPKGDLGRKFMRELNKRVALGMCFSSARDLLSQWRGYANDGRGVSLCFSYPRLQKCLNDAQSTTDPAILNSIDYDGKIGAKSFFDTLRVGVPSKIGELIRDGYLYKSLAFSEEAEWRILRVGLQNRIKDLRFRTHSDFLSPYLPLPFSLDAITEVILGPKHPTPVEKIELFLRQNDCQAPVTKSAASYR